MQNGKKSSQQVDPFTVIFRLAKQAGIIIIAVVLIKLFFFDIIKAKGDQMAPSIRKGDRILTLRFPYLPLVRNALGPSRGQPVIFDYPFSKKRGCLRVAGIAGDTIQIDSGAVTNHSNKKIRLPVRDSALCADVIPAEFSPRDFMPTLILPQPGTTLLLDSLDLFSFFTAISIIRQENPQSACSLAVTLEINGTPALDFFLADFVMYKGALNAVPDSLRYDWFFWNRLKEYLQLSNRERIHRLIFSFIKNHERVARYTVKKRFLFLIADQWKTGYDSRYVGPIAHDRIISRPLAVLWSIAPGGTVTIKRIGKFIP
jgi:signal peptidase I